METVTKYGLKNKFIETNLSDIELFSSGEEMLDRSEYSNCMELFNVYLYEINTPRFNGNTLRNVISCGYEYTETIIPEIETAKLISSIKDYTYFQDVTNTKELAKAIKLDFIQSLKLLHFSETFSILLYEKCMKNMPAGKVPFEYRYILKIIIKNIIALWSEKLSKDMLVYLVLEEIKNIK